ncbi:RagB/SusD family nutrient uptake outer membrane protein [Psychroflexus montanilacus]|uniref:RagB/SusD family nutrient uptake outer membrane protein n=1 Tax=Psychroflexus montanilacus TaxID=2873598 RepID=UPI001CCFF486|nr:RagB/SusD family nutrient uptake outer membrane protein [Psychroflexus montanilacus]MBZ9651912.1 RagB/SusD family nutrient uptake outer membrane protein [Psychroflexus montanilacus]
MKRLHNIFLLSLFTVALVACSDELDRIPVDQATADSAFQTVDDLELGLSGIYDVFPAPAVDGSILDINSLQSDNTKIGADSGGQKRDIFNFEVTSQSAFVGNFYLRYNRLANRATRLIQSAESIEPELGEEQRYDFLLGQAYALRGYAFYELMRFFSPDLLDPNGVAVPYFDEVLLSGDFPARNTVSEVKQGIFKDLDIAEDLIGDNDDIFRTNADFVPFLRARVELITGEYENVLTIADDLIARYPLANREQYVDMFSDEDNTEVVFKREFVQAEARIGGAWYFTGTGGAFIEMSNQLFNTLDTLDVRYQVNLDVEGSDPEDNLHLIGKYPGSGGFNFLNDFKAMRISEMHLMKAEAEARLDRLTDAAQSLKTLRDARFEDPQDLEVFGNRTEALQSVLDERRIELAFEGHRFIDLKRFRFDINQGLVRDPSDCIGSAPCTLATDDFRFTLPIPLDEVNSNPNINENNPGY